MFKFRLSSLGLGFLSLSLILLTGCGSREEVFPPHDNSEEVEAYYQSFKRVPPDLQAQLNNGEITQEEFNAAMEEVPLFFQFRTPEDIPGHLVWENGMDLPEFSDPNAQVGGTLYGSLQDFPRTFRIVGPDANGSFRPFLLDDIALRLARRHPNVTHIGENGHYHYPELAAEWAVDRPNKTVYVRLKEHAMWSDGVPVTSDDFMFMFFLFQSSYIREPWYNNWYTDMYTGITRFDEHTFAISVPEDKPDMNARVLNLRPLPRHFYSELTDDFAQRYQWRFQPTTGAYVIYPENVRRGSFIVLTRQPDWWAQNDKFLRNRFNFERMRLTVIRDVVKSFESFRRGDLDMSGHVNLPEYHFQKFPDNAPEIVNGFIHKVTFYNDIPRPSFGLWMNQSRPLLDNRNIRVGINYATNFERVIEEYFRGDFQRMQTTADGFGEFTHPTLRARTFDVDRALAEFAKAGFTRRGPDGILVNDNGQRLSFTLTTGYRDFQDMVTILREEAAKAGLDLRLEVLDSTAGWKKVQEKNHDIAFTAFNVSPEMYPRYWETYHSVNAWDQAFLEDGVTPNPNRRVKTQTNNLQVIAIPELDRKIEAYRRSSDVEEMRQLAFAMEEILHHDASFVPGFVRPFYRVAYWRWVRWPDDFNVKLSRSAGEYYLHWIDEQKKEETLRARRRGETFPPFLRVFDQFKPAAYTTE